MQYFIRLTSPINRPSHGLLFHISVLAPRRYESLAATSQLSLW